MNVFLKGATGFGAIMLSAAAVAAYKSTDVVQIGFPGVGMEIVETKAQQAEALKANVAPSPLPAASPDGTLAVDAYQNVQVLGHLPSSEFTRLMTAMTLWVSPDEGCAYCHAPERDSKGAVVRSDEGYPQADLKNMQSDELYTKRVARRMLQMTMRINGDWQEHVKTTGVTCYTCHRGGHVPANIWYDQESTTSYQPLTNATFEDSPGRLVRGPTDSTGLTSLPSAAFRAYLASDENIRVQSNHAIDTGNTSSIKEAEYTYGFMMHVSSALGVNCTFCHNSRSMGEWNTSPATRATAWYGIRMVRELNKDYLEPLVAALPKERLGALGDSPKANCATCHAGAYKPMLGVSMLADYRALAGAKPQPQKTPAAPVAAPEIPAPDGGLDAAIDAAVEAAAPKAGPRRPPPPPSHP